MTVQNGRIYSQLKICEIGLSNATEIMQYMTVGDVGRVRIISTPDIEAFMNII